jgi:hypothetical protein
LTSLRVPQIIIFTPLLIVTAVFIKLARTRRIKAACESPQRPRGFSTSESPSPARSRAFTFGEEVVAKAGDPIPCPPPMSPGAAAAEDAKTARR